MSVHFPGETAEYRAARERLLAREIELRRLTEAVAAERRALPLGGLVPEDYLFDSELGVVRLSELFGPHRELAVYSFMFPRDPFDDRPGDRAGACPSCVATLDQLDGMTPHSDQRIAFAVVAKAPIAGVAAFAKQRGWRNLRLVSAAGNSFQRDYQAETTEGYPRPMLNVFQRTADGTRHFWGSELLYAPTEPGQDPRHIGTLEPLWNILDLTREGRGDWDERLDYCCT